MGYYGRSYITLLTLILCNNFSLDNELSCIFSMHFAVSLKNCLPKATPVKQRAWGETEFNENWQITREPVQSWNDYGGKEGKWSADRLFRFSK